MLLSYAIADFHLFYDGPVDLRTQVHLTKSHCRVSDTQLTVKAYGSNVLFFGGGWGYNMSGNNQVNGR